MAEAELAIESKEEVAYKLMRLISSAESKDTAKYLKPDARTYYLTLFHQCIRAGQGGRDIEDILKPGPRGNVA